MERKYKGELPKRFTAKGAEPKGALGVGCPISKVIMQKVNCQKFTFPFDSNANLLDGEGELPK